MLVAEKESEMSFDIYGNTLRPGYCEVHPQVQEEYPCSLCITGKQLYDAQQYQKQPEWDLIKERDDLKDTLERVPQIVYEELKEDCGDVMAKAAAHAVKARLFRVPDTKT